MMDTPEDEIDYTKSLNENKHESVLSQAALMQGTIRNALKAKRIVLIKKKHRKKRKKNRLQIFSGGLPGLGKRT